MSEVPDKLDAIGRKLDVIINLLFKSIEEESGEVPASKKIVTLSSFGLRPSEIAKIVGKSENYVNVQLSLSRKGKKQAQKGGDDAGGQ